ncbi:DNA sulfur modification protein DndB [Gaopeijia maritima]|uniref:DNA sulfur modification protein DndB n=1 Tax=Gaopeijia maritima TaxID=3119007 RepID=UPI0032724573
METFSYVFPAIRGVQAKREYFVAMCPLGLLPKLFLFDEEELAPEHRAQRRLNKARIPEMSRYVVENPESYAFSAITASVDAEVSFVPTDPSTHDSVGVLHVPMSARFVINDGQHRRAAIERALESRPELEVETIAVVFYLDRGLERCQQLFADLNRYAVRPTRSLSLLYDHRDDHAQRMKAAVVRSKLFRDLVEMEKSSLSMRSRKLFTLSALYNATEALLQDLPDRGFDDWVELVQEFWESVSEHMPEWQLVRKRKMNASEVRQDFIHSHGIVLQAIGRAGNILLRGHPAEWKEMLSGLREIDWSRGNARQWEGRAMIGGRVSKASNNVTLTTNVVKLALGLDLNPEETRVEQAHKRGEMGKD